jgi:antitoxin component YwqK of YwqJK toxin-antitoxin module
MAYIMSFLALFLFADRLVAQHKVVHDDSLRLHRLDYENSSGEVAVTTFYYDQDGIMRKADWETKDGVRYSKNIYRYDDRGRMISCYREFRNLLTSYEIYVYDDAGRKVHESFIRSDGVKGTADYVYDKKGRCERVICQHYKGWIDGDIVYRYPKKGPAHDAVIMKDDNEIGRIVFDYDKDGNLVKDTWTFNSGWQQIFTYHYETIPKL